MGRIVGIDLGTTTSEIAYIKNGKPEIIKNGYSSITPSVVGLDKNFNIIVGERAKRQLVNASDRTIAEVKRKMGTGENVILGGKRFTPVAISAEILKELKKIAEVELREPITEAVITVPANFNDAQRQATKEAGERAGFIVNRIINEPTAAALAFGIDHMSTEGKILVYDIGGGTFDVTVLEMIEGSLDVMASRGVNRLGGKDFDEKIVDEMLAFLHSEYGVNLDDELQATERLKVLGRIKEEAEKAKIELSSAMSVYIELPFLLQKDGEIINFEMELTRTRYEQLIEGYIQQSFDTANEALKAAGLTPTDIDIVLAVGGSSRTPIIIDRLKRIFGDKLRGGINPDEAVALGAAVQAGINKNEISGDNAIAIFDVCNHSLGVDVVRETNRGLESGYFSRIILRDTHLPISRTEGYSTVEDYQDNILLQIYQGEDNRVENNIKLGELEVVGIPVNKAGDEEVEVTFKYNINGILEVTAKIVSTGMTASTRINMMDYDAPKSKSEEKMDDLMNEAWTQASEIRTTVMLYQSRRAGLPENAKKQADELMRKLKEAVVNNDAKQIEYYDDNLTALLFEY